MDEYQENSRQNLCPSGFSSKLTVKDVIADISGAKFDDVIFSMDGSVRDKTEKDFKGKLERAVQNSNDKAEIQKVLHLARLHEEVQKILKNGYLDNMKEKTQKLVKELSDQLNCEYSTVK